MTEAPAVDAGGPSVDAGPPFAAGEASVALDGGSPDSLPWDVRFAFAGGLSSIIGAPVSPAGSVILDVGNSGPGVSLDGALDANSTLTAAGGTLTFNTQSLTLSARWRLGRERVALDLGLGARGARVSVTPAGFTTNTAATRFSLGPAATATLWVRLAGPLHLVVRGWTALRLPADQFVVTNGPTFTLGLWQAGAVAGLALAWP